MRFIYKSILDCIREEIDRAETRMRPIAYVELSRAEFDELSVETNGIFNQPGEFNTIDGIPIKIK